MHPWPTEGVDPLEALVTRHQRWPEPLAALFDVIATALAEDAPAIPPADRRLAAIVVKRLAETYGGTTLYWPKSDSLERALRDLSIWSCFDGTLNGPHGITVLARQYHLSEMRVYQILKAERVRHQAEYQLTLPLEDELTKTL